mgnify:CR=1 FL=1
MEDFLKKEIDKIAEVLGLIASKLGLGSLTIPSEELTQQLNAELAASFDIDIHQLLEMSNPLEYLSERGFSDNAIELLAIMLYQAIPQTEVLNRLIKNVVDYLDNKGYIASMLHSIVGKIPSLVKRYTSSILSHIVLHETR